MAIPNNESVAIGTFDSCGYHHLRRHFVTIRGSSVVGVRSLRALPVSISHLHFNCHRLVAGAQAIQDVSYLWSLLRDESHLLFPILLADRGSEGSPLEFAPSNRSKCEHRQ